MTTAPNSRVLTVTSADGSRLHIEVYGSEGRPRLS